MPFFKPKEDTAALVDFDHLPRHVAIIMDGNGRWAKKRGLPRTAGHAAGAENFRTIATYCKEIGLEYLTVYAFSTENWKRPAEEVSAIMGLLKKYLIEAIGKMERDRVKMCFFGDLSPLPQELRDLCEQTREISKHYEGVQVNICLNYGGRDELVRAAKAFALDCAAGKADPNHLTEAQFGNYLFSAGVPDPDLVIRPSGEERISNFLLWQSAYAEYYFTDVLWPDFNRDELHRALAAYQHRQRRFGGVING
ncbi:di-trans,poly-cis-decaprenylcistransferase [Pseudoflavonifractor capillosus ATCC 29799]|uniref:Isoprenyl transferase n=1 Tax=Pseudoflavonifractor capillosus ATCC 29799 TaxID=411467 RepID=A6P0N7_9FIRM|nr:isoprenyl transferase [Pseudoflavonifractor capillosus]EDM98169.1 di-trans,poly-cis-decaprenylcistransferase [Pseudoflavonifractor capillosus ATCC 29799]SCI66117.1 Undecaprenyl pyrophosphate synthase [uncultured Flavonifractor sp.]